ncbi:Type 1 glutamine amidotransferase-like domain-containing protein [Bifidobacterium sp. 2450]|uniref:Type 1 glutamine amidotransferase-like domain-containing protein n=1 Tax=Bifidobacterium sp. 2450 TaxID=3342075 RepID=UPI0035A97247
MVTMLLTSIFRNASSAVHEVEPHPQGKRVAFIPTANAVEPWGPVHSALSKRALQRLGFEVEQLDVEDVPSGSAERVTRSIAEADCIYVGGGNTFFLLQELRRTGADRAIIEQVRAGTSYIGESAGSVITAPDIGYIKLMDRTDKTPDLTDYAGLGLADFRVVDNA